MIMKRKLTSSSSSSYSYLVRRRLTKKRVKAALFRAAVKKKKQNQDQVDEACSSEFQQRGPDAEPIREEGGFLEYASGFFLNGEFVQMTRGFLVNLGAGLPPYYFPVVDNHGFLLGEFRKLDDDLNFVQEEEKNPVSYTSFLPPGLYF